MSTEAPVIVHRSERLNHLAETGQLNGRDGIERVLQVLREHRGVADAGDVDYSLKRLASPQTLKHVNRAVALLAQALEQNQHIVIVGDFDADGATSSALAVLALNAMGHAAVSSLVPNRFEYGYGLTPEIVDLAIHQYPDVALIVTVDNGIASVDGVARANAAGIPVLVTDHHLPGATLPEAAAIVNPNQPGCEFPSKNLAGVGVIFYLMSSLRSHLREQGWFAQLGLSEPNMASFLDLVALGTVADVVPLDHLNRTLVHQGILRIRARACRPGILALLEVSGRRPEKLVASDLGFAIGPRLNAAGRLDDMSLGIQCLLTDNPGLAHDIAMQLDDLNSDRKSIESSMQQEALNTLSQLNLEDDVTLPWALSLYQPGWHQGVVGIVASRIKDRYHRPTIAFAEAEEGLLKGSARSINGFHIRDALDLLSKRHEALIQKFGGHAMAAGLTIRQDDFEAFSNAFDATARELLTEADLTAQLFSDGCLPHELMTLPMAEALQNAGPWGQQFPEPLFDGEFVIVQQRLVGAKHLKLVLADAEGSQRIIDAIAFNVDLTQWPNPSAKRVHAAYQLQVNEFRGQRTPQLLIQHLALLPD